MARTKYIFFVFVKYVQIIPQVSSTCQLAISTALILKSNNSFVKCSIFNYTGKKIKNKKRTKSLHPLILLQILMNCTESAKCRQESSMLWDDRLHCWSHMLQLPSHSITILRSDCSHLLCIKMSYSLHRQMINPCYHSKINKNQMNIKEIKAGN